MKAVTSKASAPRLRRLWENRVSLVLSNLEKGERQHREIANAASHIGADYHGRFLIELLQNASDQAAKAELAVSTLVLVRTVHSVALVNQGMPFDEAGVKSITSLALSPKNAEESLGNKGVGFKAVFQVSDGPEIFSTASAGEGLTGGVAHAFRLDKAPLERTDVHDVIVAIAEQCLAAQPRARDVIEAMAHGEAAVDVVMREIAASPPWKFPIQLDDADLMDRANALGLESEWLEMMQTLVVLPLIDDETTRQIVERAIDEVRVPETLLFLPRVNELIIVDRLRNIHERIQKKAVTKPVVLIRGERIVEWETSVAADGGATTPGRRWWIASRTMGDPAGIGDEEAKLERHAIRQATSQLPGDGWAKVERAVVSVALLQPESGSCSLPREHGVFCIGLPTGVRTGLPIWVDAHFHGIASRTGIDFTIRYNTLLLDEAEIVTSALVEHLKREPSIEARRSATLAMVATTGQLATRIWSPNGLAHSDVVLAADGETFVKGVELAMPHVEDISMLRILTSDSDIIARSAGFVLPERELLVNARTLLDALSTPAKAADYDGRFLARQRDRPSLVESAAAEHRSEGPEFWEPFLTWLIKRFRFELLEDQVVLPVGPEGLACANNRVFIEPIGSSETGQPTEDEEVDASTLHEDVRRALRFLDSNAITVRTGTRRDVTPLVAQLSPLAGARLVSRPRIEQLLEHAVAPRIAEVSRDPEKRELTVELLRFAIELTQRLKGPKVRARVDLSTILVPAARPGESWEWVSPSTVYFGPGWSDEETNEALESAFGHRAHARLVPWEGFAVVAGPQSNDARSWWSTGMGLLGVMDRPRIRSVERFVAFRSRSYEFLTPLVVASPIAEASTCFAGWIGTLARRRTDRKGGQEYEITSVSWIDGLEREEGRAAVLRMVLAQPGEYATHATTYVRRTDTGDAREAPAMWIYAIRWGDWPILEVEGEVYPKLVPPSRAFWLTTDERRKESSRLLAAVPARLTEAVALLSRLGVTTLAEASLGRVIASLHQFAVLPPEAWEKRPIASRALVADLWDRLRSHCAREREDTHGTLAALLEHPVPLFRGRILERADLRQIEFLYVNDEPIRANFVEGIENALLLPLMRDVQALVRGLRAVLGAERVRTTSEAAVVTGFVPAAPGVSTPLLELFDEAFPENNVPVDLGMLRAFGGRRDVDPRQKDFTDFRADLERTRVVRGTFESHGRIAPRSFYEKSASTLQVAHDSAPVDIVEGSWQIAGSAYRELWSSYSKSLLESKVAQFFAEREIGDADREVIEVVMQRGQNAKLAVFRSAAFAIRTARGYADLRSFHAGWDEHARSVDDLDAWLGGDLRMALHAAIDLVDEGEASRRVLAAAGIGIEAWQAARNVLGLASWSFEETRHYFVEARNTLVAALKSETARLFRVDLDITRGVLEALGATAPSEELCTTYHDREESLEQVLAVARDHFAVCRPAEAVVTLVDRVDALAAASREERAGMLDKLGTAREKDVYRRDAEPIRSHQATEERDNLLRVAVPLAAHRNEALDYATITADVRVQAFSNGFWANRFGVLTALQHAIASVAPGTARALSEQRAFHEHVQWRDLWRQVPELGPIPEAEAPPKPPPRVIALFGRNQAEDTLANELRLGTTGSLGERVRSLVETSLDLALLGQGVRPLVAAPPRSKGGHGGGGGSGTGESKADRELSGLLGEIWVYEQLRGLLPNFDEFSWVSLNRSRYGFADGDDGLGYDFRYVDLDGTLSGVAKPIECLIEVKSTSGDGRAPFPLTMNEWLRAETCQLSAGDVCYMILRVAFVRTHPKIVDIIRNPVALASLGQLAVSSKDLWVRVAEPKPG